MRSLLWLCAAAGLAWLFATAVETVLPWLWNVYLNLIWPDPIGPSLS
jgi:hypothetical protein